MDATAPRAPARHVLDSWTALKYFPGLSIIVHSYHGPGTPFGPENRSSPPEYGVMRGETGAPEMNASLSHLANPCVYILLGFQHTPPAHVHRTYNKS